MGSLRFNAMAAQRAILSLTLVLTICALGLVLASPPQNRLLGGEDATAGEFPWSASLRYKKAHICSACIISTTQLLTAAHCVSDMGTTPVDASTLDVRVGSINQYAGGSIVGVSSVRIHPSYGNFLHDLALVTLSQPLTFNERIAAVALPKAETTEEGETLPISELPDGTPVFGAGWGEQSDGNAAYKLQKANFNTLSSSYCELAAGYGYESVLCLKGTAKQGVCRGDAGAGILDDNKVLQGCVSFWFGECDSAYPNIATRIAYYLDWIHSAQE